MDFLSSLDRDLSESLKESDSRKQKLVQKAIEQTVSSLLDIVIDIKDEIEQEWSQSRREEENGLPHAQAAEAGGDDEARRGPESAQSAIQQEIQAEIRRIQLQQLAQLQKIRENQESIQQLQRPDAGMAQKAAVPDELENKAQRNQSTVQHTADAEDAEDAGRARPSTSILQDDKDLEALIFSISEIENDKNQQMQQLEQQADRFIRAKREQLPQLAEIALQTDDNIDSTAAPFERQINVQMLQKQQFEEIRQQLEDQKYQQQVIQQQLQQNSYQQVQQHQQPTSSSVNIPNLLLTNQVSEHAQQAAKHSAPQDVEEEISENFQCIDSKSFKIQRIQSPKPKADNPRHSSFSNIEDCPVDTQVAKQQSPIVRQVAPQAQFVPQKPKQQYPKPAKQYRERFSQKIYTLNEQLREKEKSIADLEMKLKSQKSLSSSQQRTNHNLQEYLKREKDSRQQIQQQMLSIKQDFEIQLKKERKQGISLNKVLLQQITQLSAQQLRNSQLENPLTTTIKTDPPKGEKGYEVVQPPDFSSPKGISQQQDFDQLLEQLYTQTISVEARQQLNPKQQRELKSSLREQLLNVLQLQGINQQLHFTPIKLASENFEGKVNSPSVKLIDPPGDPGVNSSVVIPLSLSDKKIQEMQQYNSKHLYIKEPEKAKPNTIQVDQSVKTSVPIKLEQVNPVSESSDISRLSKVRNAKIKPFGEIGCLILVNLDEKQYVLQQQIDLLDRLKDIAGQIPCIHKFSELSDQKFELLKDVDFQSVMLNSLMIQTLFICTGAIPQNIQLQTVKTAQYLEQYQTFEAQFGLQLLNLIIMTEQLAERSDPTCEKNFIYSLKQLNDLASIVTFNPFDSACVVIYLVVIKLLQKSSNQSILNQFTVSATILASKMKEYQKQIDYQLLSYQIVGIGCLVQISLYLDECQVDKDLRNQFFALCQEIVKQCRGIGQIPGFDKLVKEQQV